MYAASSVRPTKRDAVVIDDEESTEDQPTVKSAKRDEGPVPSPEVVELQLKLRKTEEMLQGACRAARAAELRAEEAESKLDSKYGIQEGFEAERMHADELEMKLVEVSQENESLKLVLNGFSRENESLNVELTEMRQEYHERIDDLSDRLAEYEYEAGLQYQELLQPPYTQHGIMDQQHISPSQPSQRMLQQFPWRMEEAAATTQLLPPHSQGGIMDQQHNSPPQSRTQRLLQPLPYRRYAAAVTAQRLPLQRRRLFEDRLLVPPYALPLKLQLQLQQVPREATAVAAPTLTTVLPLHEICHPTDIFQLCRPSKEETMPLGEAFGRLKAAATKGKAQFIQRCKIQEMVLQCDLCEKTFSNYAIINHFLSMHYHKAKGLGSAVSRAALKYWVNLLQPEKEQLRVAAAAAAEAGSSKRIKKETDGLAARPMQQEMTAASPRWVGAPKGIKKEEVND